MIPAKVMFPGVTSAELLRRISKLKALTAAVWDESKHPRDPGGEGGGQWIPKEATPLGGAESVADTMRAIDDRKAEVVARLDAMPEGAVIEVDPGKGYGSFVGRWRKQTIGGSTFFINENDPSKGKAAGEFFGIPFTEIPEYRGLHEAPGRDGGAPIWDLANDETGGYPDDVYGPDAARLYGDRSTPKDQIMAEETITILRGLRDRPNAPVTIYRAVPAGIDAINPGDWVTPNRHYAEQHALSNGEADWRVIERTVPANELFTDANSIHEFGWDPAVTAAAWDESKHPRDPGGEGGGQFIPKGVGAEDEGLAQEALAQMEKRDMTAPKPLPPGWSGPVIEPTAETVRHWDEFWHGENREFVYKQNGMTADEYRLAAEERAREDMDIRYVALRSPIELVDEIVDDGRFKSQHETGTTRGSLNPTSRVIHEARHFGYPEMPETRADAPEWLRQRPIYGYMSDPRDAETGAAVEQYGEVKWELKNDVRHRTTFTDNDSLGTGIVPSPVDDPAWYSLMPPSTILMPEPGMKRRRDVSRDPMRTPIGNGLYAEAQIHGGVTLDDVAAVQIPGVYVSKFGKAREEYDKGRAMPHNEHAFNQAKLLAAIEKMKAKGITVEFT